MVFSIGRGISGVGLATIIIAALPRATLYQYWHIGGDDTTEKGLDRDRPAIPVTWRVSYSTALQGAGVVVEI